MRWQKFGLNRKKGKIIIIISIEKKNIYNNNKNPKVYLI